EANLIKLKDEMARQTDKKAGVVEAKSPRQKLDPSVFTDSAFPKLRPVEYKHLETFLDTVGTPISKEIALNLPKKHSALERLRFEQVQEGLRSIDKMNKLIAEGKWEPDLFPVYSNVTASVYMVAAGLQPTNKGKLRCYEAQLVFANMMEKMISVSAMASRDPFQESDSARFYRLEAEAQLLKAMDVLGEGKSP
ncbi:MAG TPA: hypothetical protein VG122_03525, partial [Gemmata sp.]|nr:hypothetical protein [Gemmata sp.]